MSQADTAIAFELAQVGKPYQWGATGPDTFDCSGLQVAGWRAAGVALPRTSYQQMSVGRAVSQPDLAPGDLVFPHPGHVQMYLGNGYVVEAPRTGENVRVQPIGTVAAARRVADIPGVTAIIRNVSTGNYEVNPALHLTLPNPFDIGKDLFNHIPGVPNIPSVPNPLSWGADKIVSAIYDGIFKPFVDVIGHYVWRAGMVVLGAVLIVFAIWMWKPAQDAAKATVAHAQRVASNVTTEAVA